MWIAHLILGFIFAIVTALVAHNRGRNALGWFIVGFLVGPVGLIVAALPALPRPGLYARCPSCSEVVQAQAVVCRFCGANLAHSPQPES